MSVSMRLSRGGSKKRPYYKIVVADARSPRDGRFIEKVGSYNPMLPSEHADRIRLQEDRLKHWLGNGAVATERVARWSPATGWKVAGSVQVGRNAKRPANSGKRSRYA